MCIYLSLGDQQSQHPESCDQALHDGEKTVKDATENEICFEYDVKLRPIQQVLTMWPMSLLRSYIGLI